MKIVLTGGSGQLGEILKPLLAAVGTVVAPPRSRLDLAEPASIEEALNQLQPDVIVNAGAYTDVDGAEGAEDLAYAANGRAPGVIGRWASSAGAVVIHVSTDYVFDGDGSHPLTEEDTPRPVNVYGRTKLAGEQALLATPAVAVVLRTAWLFGPAGSNFLKRVTGWAQTRERISVVDDQVGSPTTTLWLAPAIATLVERLHRCDETERASLRGIYHAAGAGMVDRRSFAQAILDDMALTGQPLACREILPARSADFPAPARRPAFSALSSRRFSETWGVMPQSWREGVSEVVAALAIVRR